MSGQKRQHTMLWSWDKEGIKRAMGVLKQRRLNYFGEGKQLTYELLKEYTGVPVATLDKYLKGEIEKPSADVLWSLCAVLKPLNVEKGKPYQPEELLKICLKYCGEQLEGKE